MTKYVLIGGYIYNAKDKGRAFCDELVSDIHHRPIKILDCLFARERETWDKRFVEDKEFFHLHLKEVEVELAEPSKFIEQAKDCDIIFFQGGVPRTMISLLDSAGEWKNSLKGKVVVGSSGGADALCKYYGVGKTMNIGEGLGILPIKIIPHWKSKSNYAKNLSIDWEGLYKKLKSHKEDLEVFTIKEGEFVTINK